MAITTPIALPKVSPALLARLEAAAERRPFAKGAVLYEEGFPCPAVPLLLSGGVRVFKLGESGREITLYRVMPGQLCVLSSACALAGEESRLPAVAVAESDGEMLALPNHVFRRLLTELPELQAYLNSVLAGRMSEIMSVVDQVAFGRVDVRLAALLAREAAAHPGGLVAMTHAQLAVELGSVREVVSRNLKDFERRGLVRLGRGRVTVTDRAGLEALVAQGEE